VNFFFTVDVGDDFTITKKLVIAFDVNKIKVEASIH